MTQQESANFRHFEAKLLEELNNRYPTNPVMRETARIYEQRRTILESRRPQTGVFWWAPHGKGGWRLVPFLEDEYGRDLLHEDVWRRWCATILNLKTEQSRLPRSLLEAYAGLPRGRVDQPRGPRSGGARWVIYHGGDAPVADAERLIASVFQLPAGGWRAVVDDHEQLIADDVAVVERAVGRSLGVAVPTADWDDDEDDEGDLFSL